MAYRDPVTGQLYTIGPSGVTTNGVDVAPASSDTSTSISAEGSHPIGTTSAAIYMFRWLLAWTIALLLLSLANRTRLGHVIIYYLLALSLLFLTVTQYRWFAAALSPITGAATTPPAG